MLPFLVNKEETFFSVSSRNISHDVSPRSGEVRGSEREGKRGGQTDREPEEGGGQRLRRRAGGGRRVSRLSSSPAATPAGPGGGQVLARNCKG